MKSITIILVPFILASLLNFFNRENYFKPEQNLCQNTAVISDGFAWAENVIVTRNGIIYVTDNTQAKLYRIEKDGNIDPFKYQKRQEVPITGNALQVEQALGLTLSETEEFLFIVTKQSFKNLKGKHQTKNVITKLNISNSGHEIWVEDILVMRDEFFFNGLGLHFKSNKLYTTNEYYFTPHQGIVIEISLNNLISSSPNYNLYEFKQLKINGLCGADGLWVDQKSDTVFIGMVFCLSQLNLLAKNSSLPIITYDINSQKQVNIESPFHHMDDFSVSPDGQYFVGADFFSGNIIAFRLDDLQKGKTDSFIIGENFNYPTSVRFVPNEPNSLIVTESGLIKGSLGLQTFHNQKIYKMVCE